MEGSELLMIFIFVIVAASIVFGFVTKVHQRGIAHEERKLELKAQIAEAKAGAGVAIDSKLEDRVRVLERLATDRGVSLADEIESLRAESPALNDHRENKTQELEGQS